MNDNAKEQDQQQNNYAWSAHPANIPDLYRAAFNAIETLAIAADHIASKKKDEWDEHVVEKCLNAISGLTKAMGR